MITSFAKLINNVFGVETQYTNQINLIVDRMQDDGYEIIDIDFNQLKNDGAFGLKTGFSTLIRYK